MTEPTNPTLQEHCAKVAEVLQSSQAMVKWNWEVCDDSASEGEDYHDPEWTISPTQEEAKVLMSNLTGAAAFFGQTVRHNRNELAGLVDRFQRAGLRFRPLFDR